MQLPAWKQPDASAFASTLQLADCLSDEGTVVNYGLLSGEPCQMAADMVIFRGLNLTGFWLAKLLGGMQRAEIEAMYGDLCGRVADGSMGAAIEASYGLDELGAAFDHAMRGGRSGKVLITPNGPIS